MNNIGFNTQPPEGGCRAVIDNMWDIVCFNTQPPEGGCLKLTLTTKPPNKVSTHSHPKAAAIGANFVNIFIFSFNTQPPEGGCLPLLMDSYGAHSVSTHSHPKAAAGVICWVPVSMRSFQHTATRRRLRTVQSYLAQASKRFNTQPPEGGCPPCVFAWSS